MKDSGRYTYIEIILIQNLRSVLSVKGNFHLQITFIIGTKKAKMDSEVIAKNVLLKHFRNGYGKNIFSKLLYK